MRAVAAEHVPSKSLCGKVEKIILSDWIIADMNLGISSWQDEVVVKLRHGNVPTAGSLNLEPVRRSLRRPVIGMSGLRVLS